VLYLVGFGIPALMIFPRMPPMFWGTIALVLTYSAYVAEVLPRRHGGGASVAANRGRGSLGLTHGQTLRIVVIPQGPCARSSPPS